MRPWILAAAVLATATQAAAQVTRVQRPTPPNVRALAARPDVPLLVGMNSGRLVRVQDMAGGGTELLADSFAIGRTTAPARLGVGPQGRLIANVPGGTPHTRVLLPQPGWQVLDGRLQGVQDFAMTDDGQVMYGVMRGGGGRQVFRYEVATRDLRTVGTGTGTGPGQLERPEHVAVDRQGRIYVADGNRIVRMNDITGNGWTAFGSHGSGPGQFNYVRGVAVDGRGRIYVSDYFNNRIVRMDDITGAGWAQHPTSIPQPAGVAVDHLDRLYVAVPVRDQVLRMDDITGAGLRTLPFGRAAGTRMDGSYMGPAELVPLRATPSGGVIR
jgi:hypothetical protein